MPKASRGFAAIALTFSLSATGVLDAPTVAAQQPQPNSDGGRWGTVSDWGRTKANSSIRYVAAITNPLLNETPYITTEVRPIYMYTNVPRSFSQSGGGSLHTALVQIRYAVTDRIGIVVRKNGYTSAHFSPRPGAPLFPDDEGGMNFAFGAKYALIAQPERSTYLTVGATYEMPVGDISSGNLDLQGGGDGFFDLFSSFGSQVGERTGFQASAGFNLAVDGDHDSSSFHGAFHVDHEIVPRLYGVLEGNLVSTISEGARTDSALLGSFEGYDLFNFGSAASGTVTTLGLGARYRLTDHVQLGAAYELPLGGREDLIDYRFMADVVAHL